MNTTTGTRLAASSTAIEERHACGAYAKRGVAIVKGSGARVWDAGGRQYIDCSSGHGVATLGHAHPDLVEAISSQARLLITCPETYFNDRRAALLERLARLMPDGVDRFFLCNSGAEAVEAAIKFARLSTGRTEIVAMRRGFHGRTLGALSATWNPAYREPFEPLVPGFRHVAFGDVDAVSAAVDGRTAAVIVEIVQGEGGVRTQPTPYFKAVAELCASRGALLIVDEVQTGFGRTGRWFAFEHHALTPDLVCMGKAIAGGVPMGAVGIGPRVGRIPTGSHGSTFGGNPLACAAALAAIEACERDGLVSRAAEIGERARMRLEGLPARVVREVRVSCAMIGIELRVRATPLLAALLARGVLALPAGNTVLRLLPPLVISDDELDRALDLVEAVICEAASLLDTGVGGAS